MTEEEKALFRRMIASYWIENNASHESNEKEYDLTQKMIKKYDL